jgi:DNA-binding protein H-NS
MRKIDLGSMSADQLWSLNEQVSSLLADRMVAEKARLEDRLRTIGFPAVGFRRERRPYPKVLPKYRNPKNRSETWAGRGKRPRWLVAQLHSGKKLEDFQIRRLQGRGEL